MCTCMGVLFDSNRIEAIRDILTCHSLKSISGTKIINSGSVYSSVPVSHDRVTVSQYEQQTTIKVRKKYLIIRFVSVFFLLWPVRGLL